MIVKCVLSIICILMVIKIKKLQKELNETKKKDDDLIKMQELELQAVRKDKEEIQSQVASYELEVNSMQKEMEEFRRKLDFYQNIKEDSGKLNFSDEKVGRESLLEAIAEQIISYKQNQKEDDLDEKSALKESASLDKEQEFARLVMDQGNENIFITGKAGTGKSFLLDAFRMTTKKKLVVLAPTGIAALNVRGATLHSTFGYYNLVNLDVDKISDETIQLKSEKRMLLRKVDVIIIDEISMVRADTLDKIDKILKVINRNEAPFGGKQILLFGDLFQLPPVTKGKEHEYLYDRYGGEYFFCSDSYKQGNFKFIELTINHRQKDDAEFFELLNKVREGNLSDEDFITLNSRVAEDASAYDRYTTLLPTKAEAERLNQYHIDQLDSKEYVYKAKVEFSKHSSNAQNLESVFPITETLRLKKGALVMMVANDPEQRWVNGTLGIISELADEYISVAINKREYKICPTEFTEEEILYENGELKYETILRVIQYPVVLAYAITIHKSQGQTYQNIVCDLDRCFANGQAYVALSRCASLKGLHLKRRINSTHIRVDKRVQEFYKEQLNKRK